MMSAVMSMRMRGASPAAVCQFARNKGVHCGTGFTLNTADNADTRSRKRQPGSSKSTGNLIFSLLKKNQLIQKKQR